MTEVLPLPLRDVLADQAPSADGFVRRMVDAQQWMGLAAGCAKGLQDLGAIWRDGSTICAMLHDFASQLRAIIALPLSEGAYPSFSRFHAPAQRLERTLRDLHGLHPLQHPDERAWIDHGVWPDGKVPRLEAAKAPYRFLPVQGEGLHEIPVGPVHAGIIEPGHFRFTANGEAVVRLEERLGYVHKGIESLCTGARMEKAARVVARMSGDSAVAASLAFALAVEAALEANVPVRAQLLRGVAAELERMAHHVNDVGAICNDASVVALQARCALLREDILQTSQACFGHRLIMDLVAPGGLAKDICLEGPQLIGALLDRCSAGFEEVVRVYDDMPSLLDRTVTTGIVRKDYAREFAAGGFVGRASGRSFDARSAYPYAPYRTGDVVPAVREKGDVNARVWVRIMEVRSSISLIRNLLARLEAGPVFEQPKIRAGEGAALVEAFRGDLFVTLRLDASGVLECFHARDASVFQWPLLEVAIEGNIVADFPLCNKSFNCSYSGHDM